MATSWRLSPALTAAAAGILDGGTPALRVEANHLQFVARAPFKDLCRPLDEANAGDEHAPRASSADRMLVMAIVRIARIGG